MKGRLVARAVLTAVCLALVEPAAAMDGEAAPGRVRASSDAVNANVARGNATQAAESGNATAAGAGAVPERGVELYRAPIRTESESGPKPTLSAEVGDAAARFVEAHFPGATILHCLLEETRGFGEWRFVRSINLADMDRSKVLGEPVDGGTFLVMLNSRGLKRATVFKQYRAGVLVAEHQGREAVFRPKPTSTAELKSAREAFQMLVDRCAPP